MPWPRGGLRCDFRFSPEYGGTVFRSIDFMKAFVNIVTRQVFSSEGLMAALLFFTAILWGGVCGVWPFFCPPPPAFWVGILAALSYICLDIELKYLEKQNCMLSNMLAGYYWQVLAFGWGTGATAGYYFIIRKLVVT